MPNTHRRRDLAVELGRVGGRCVRNSRSWRQSQVNFNFISALANNSESLCSDYNNLDPNVAYNCFLERFIETYDNCFPLQKNQPEK